MDKYISKISHLSTKFKYLHQIKFNVKDTKKTIAEVNVGGFKPYEKIENVNINLDVDTLDKLSEEEQDFVLAHELSHVEQVLDQPYKFGLTKSRLFREILYNKSLDLSGSANDSNSLSFKINGYGFDNLSTFHLFSGFNTMLSGAFTAKVLTNGIFSKPLFFIPLSYGLLGFYHFYKSREREYDADKRAVKILGTNVGGITLLKRVKRQYPEHFTILNTHPSDKNRIKRMM
jgi:hypothetical protein